MVALLGLSGLGYRYLQRQTSDVVNAAEYDSSFDSLNRLGSHQELSIRLAASETRLEELETLFPPKLSGPSTVSRLIRMAERSYLSVSDVQTQPGTDEIVNEHNYRRLSIEIQLAGTLSSLRLFLQEMEDGAIPASRIDHLIIRDITPVLQSDGLTQYTMEVGFLLSLFSRDPLPDEPEPSPVDAEATSAGEGGS